MRRFFYLIMMCVSVMGVYGQSISLTDFYLDERDQTANERGTQVMDDNGNLCALIRIQTTEKGFVFEGGTVGIAKVEENHVGEIWVYVPAKLRRITLRHAQLGTLKDQEIPELLQQARTYYWTLTTGQVITYVNEATTKQYLTIEVTPKNALVQVDSMTVSVDDDGVATKFVDCGKHYYRVSAHGYHADAGYVTVDASGKKRLKVELLPAHGWLTVTGDQKIEGADVYVDDSKVGTLPLSRHKLPSGSHNVRIAKSLYKDYAINVTITDGNEYKLLVALAENYAEITLTAAEGVKIYVNGEYMGEERWTGPLEAGNYVIESRKENHRPQTKRVAVRIMEKKTIEVPDPLPIYGSVNVATTPNNAQIIMDGEVVGTTPELLSNVLIGQHTLVVRRDGYTELRKTITVEEGKTVDVEGGLDNIVEVALSCGVDKAEWYIDSERAGKGKKLTVPLSIGRHHITISADGYQFYSRDIDVTQTGNSFACALSKIEKQKPVRTSYTYTYKSHRYDAYYDFTDAQGKYDVSVYTLSAGLLYGWALDLSVLDFRLGPIGFRPLNLLLGASPNFNDMRLSYAPMMQVFFPVNEKGAVTLSGGVTIELEKNGRIGYIGQVGYTIHYSICASEFFFRGSDGYFTLGCTLNMHIKSKR